MLFKNLDMVATGIWEPLRNHKGWKTELRVKAIGCEATVEKKGFEADFYLERRN